MGQIVIGQEAVADGTLTEYELKKWYRPIFRGVYLPKGAEPTLRDRTTAAWLASKRKGVIAGVAASALHGANWVPADAPIELVSRNVRRQSGLVVRNETLADDEVTRIATSR